MRAVYAVFLHVLEVAEAAELLLKCTIRFVDCGDVPRFLYLEPFDERL